MNGRNSKIFRFLLGFTVCILLVGFGYGQNCRNGQCQIQSEVQPQIIDINKYEWKEFKDEPDRLYLCNNNIQVGCWDYTIKLYRPYNATNNTWGTLSTTPPYPLPVYNSLGPIIFGVDKSKCSKCEDSHCTHKGRKITTEEAIDIITNKVPSDAGKFRLTIIGSKQEREMVSQVFHSQLETELRDKINFWSLDSDNWALKDTVTGKTIFRNDGKPTLYFQAPNGKVLHRQDNWGGEKDFLAIRKAVKTYDSNKDSDLRNDQPVPVPVPNPNPNPMPSPDPLAPLKNIPIPVWILTLVSLIAILIKKYNIKLPANLNIGPK